MSAESLPFSLANALFTVLCVALVACFTMRMLRSDLDRRFAAFRLAFKEEFVGPNVGLAFLQQQTHEFELLRVEIAARMNTLEEQYDRLARLLPGRPPAED